MFLFRTIMSFFRDKIYRELLITITVLVCISTLVFRFTEHWSWLDSFYFSVSTITTTGYGDLYPKSAGGKIFNIFFLVISLILILLFINTMNQHYMERKKKKEKMERHHNAIADAHKDKSAS